MKIVVTGSLGHISKPLTEELVQNGHVVTVISRKAEKQAEIEAIGATAAIGLMEDVEFLTSAFAGMDAAYCMLPPIDFFNHEIDLKSYQENITQNYIRAIRQSNIKRVVFLSTVGAHSDKNSGILNFVHEIEQMVGTLAPDVSITFMRPVGFYYNLFAHVNTIKTQAAIISNYGGDDIVACVSPFDIASATAEELVRKPEGISVRYVASDELSCSEIVTILGKAIGKPDLQWVKISDEKMLEILLSTGMQPELAKGFVEMNAAIHNGLLFEDYYKNKPVLGKVKVADFAKEFAAVYNQ